MKIVMIINKELSPGLAANTAAVLGISLGNADPKILGPDLEDASSGIHRGITRENIPVLGADRNRLREIYEQVVQYRDQGQKIDLIDFNTLAQESRHYDEYREKLSGTDYQDLEFSGLCLFGSGKKINRLTGSLQLYQ
ncbi:DUF2000 domain-containing protein [Desulfospira joergensenii]|uniref:DUF2000 domain-containing protein n=1 Tax=Desulfospira joergensenii TaxID=53329 RepID=UPI000425EF29|nr:DUF2000 domain-containing protein [Desulfospira joergensenii]